MSHLVKGVFGLHDRQGVEVYAYSFVGGTDYAYNYDPQHVHTSGFIVLT